jgi:ABC-type transport system involved in multi-copper enzyme maturation permease subunit
VSSVTSTATTGTTAPYQSDLSIRPEAFTQLLHAELTKLRTVRGWLIGLALAAVVTVLFGLLTASGSKGSCGRDPGCFPPLGPDGEVVTDTFFFVHQPLDGDGSITVRVSSLTGLLPSFDDGSPNTRSGLHEWAKAGLIIKESTTQGSAYAAIMVTGNHGVRMQYDYTHDSAGSAAPFTAASPRWLRLTRAGETLTGFESADGTNWTEVGTTHLSGLPTTVETGMFVASPEYEVFSQGLGEADTFGGPSQATAVFDEITMEGQLSNDAWIGEEVGGRTGGLPNPGETVQDSAGTFTVTGAGDIAPAVAGSGGNTLEQSLQGVFAGLIVVIVVGAMFITAEYRRGLIRTTLAATPRRGRVLAAKAIVLGGITFVVGLAASAFAVWFIGRIRRGNGQIIIPVSSLTELRVVVGTAALLAAAAVLAMALGTMLRRSTGAVAGAIALLVLPYILAIASVLPSVPAQWLLRLTPAAGFAIQQSTKQYAQVRSAYTPATGYFPLAPWAGFAVLCAWTAVAVCWAGALLRKRDA